MAKAATGSERGFDATVYSPASSGDNSQADRAPFGALRPIEAGADLNPELPALLKLGTLKQEMGSYAEAEDFFRKALELGDRMFGPEHQEMIILLNDLTRLYLKQGSYASAEPLLLRLFDLKKSKGEDHPEVATVLASLASVRQALGRHESAEQLWRHVVDIRERTLAPNHFATATALENLGQSCAARGKNRTALAAFERALLIRERTLGAEHPSLRTGRERIADLQLQGSDDSSYPDDELERLPMPQERFRLSAGERSVPAPTALPTHHREDREAKEVDRAPLLAMPRPVTGERKPENHEPDESAMELDESEPLRLAAVAAYRDALESVRRDLDEPSDTPTFWARQQTQLVSLFGFLRGRQVAGAIAMSAIGLLVLGSAAMSGAKGERGVEGASPAAGQTPAISVPVVGADRTIAPTQNTAVLIPASAVSKPVSTVTREADTHTSPRKAPEKAAQPSISIPKLANTIMSGVEAVASKAGTAPAPGVESFSLQGAVPLPVRRGSFTDNQAEPPQHARLIGELPKPRVPSRLADIEGDVRLRFTVGTDGRPVISSVSVVSSTNQELADAAKRVIPSMRFEPAKTGGPDPKAVTEVVHLEFVFSSHGQ